MPPVAAYTSLLAPHSATYAPFETPARDTMSVEQIGQNWFVMLGNHILHFIDGQAKLAILKKLYMDRLRKASNVHWMDIEEMLAREDFTMPRLTKLFTSRASRRDRIAMFVEALQDELHRKTFGDWKIVTYSASNGDMYFSLHGPLIKTQNDLNT